MVVKMAAKAKAKTRGAATPMLEGFRKVETAIGGFWKPEGEGEWIRGVVGAAVEAQGEEGPNVFYTLVIKESSGTTILNGDKEVDAKDGMIVGVGGKMLHTFLSTREGVEVILVYRGMGVAKKGRSAPKLYDTYEAVARDDD